MNSIWFGTGLLILLWAIMVAKNLWDVFYGYHYSRKYAGQLLYKDDSYSPDSLTAIILSLCIFLFSIFIVKIDIFFFRSLSILLLIWGVATFPFKMEIREKGIFSKAGFRKWEDIRYYQLKKRDTIFNFRLKTKFRYISLTIDFDRRDEIDGILKQYIRSK